MLRRVIPLRNVIWVYATIVDMELIKTMWKQNVGFVNPQSKDMREEKII